MSARASHWGAAAAFLLATGALANPPFPPGQSWPPPEDAPPRTPLPVPAVPTPAPAPTVASAEAAFDSWRVGFGLEVYSATDGTRLAASGQALGDFYLRPLLDDPARPLALLSFDQHPPTLSAAAGTTPQGAAASVGLSVYPWDDTGFSAGVGLVGDTVLEETRGNWSLLAGRYFLRDLRGQLGYVGDRWAQPALNGGYDGVHGSLDGLAGPVLWSLAFDVGQSQEAAVPTTGASLQFFYKAGTLQATVYLGRRWSAAVFGGATDLALGNPASRGSQSSQFVGVSAEFYVTDALHVSAAYRFTLHEAPPGSQPLPGYSFVDTAAQLHGLTVTAFFRH